VASSCCEHVFVAIGIRCRNRRRNGRSQHLRKRVGRSFSNDISVLCHFAIAKACALSLYSVHRLLGNFFLENNISFGLCGRFTENTDAERLTCIICLETFKEDSLISTMLCGHMYHGPCLYKWLTTLGKRKACPCCNEGIEVLAQVSLSTFFLILCN
jgi:hypothetical protein